MSIEKTSEVWKHSRQKSGALLVLLALADFTNSKGIAWPAVSTLARKVRMSKRNVQRCVRALQKAGELEVLWNQGRRGSNVYRICVPTVEPDEPDANVTHDAGVAKAPSPMSSRDDTGVTQSVNESSTERTPIVPKGDDIKFWIKVSFDCFKQIPRPLPRHVLRGLARGIPALDRKNAASLLKFYRIEELDSREPPYSSRRHSPERLILDLPRQLALAVQTCPLSKAHDFAIEDVHDYLTRTYPGCDLPDSLDELDSSRWDYIRSEVYAAMRNRPKAKTKESANI